MKTFPFAVPSSVIWFFIWAIFFVFAVPVKAAPYVVDIPVLNLRSCKGTNCKIVAKLTEGEIVNVSDDNGSWVKVKTEKGNGYIAKRYLKKIIIASKSESNIGGFFFYGILFVFLIAGVFNIKKEQKSPQVKESSNGKKSSLYDVLGISSEASLEEIKKAYKKLAKNCHPDLNPNNTYAAGQFRKINEAYEILKDEEKRTEYDASIKTQKTEEYTTEQILLSADSIQELRRMLAECLDILPTKILFNRNGDVFVNQQYAFCWRPVEQTVVINRRYYIKTYFQYYRPINPYPDELNFSDFEVIILTAPDILSFKRYLGIYFDQAEKRIVLADDGRVYVDGTPDWFWHYSGTGYFEYYRSINEDFGI